MVAPTKPITGTDWLRKQVQRVTDGATLPVTPTVAATVEVEAWLQGEGVSYAPPTAIPMHMIDEKRSRHNQARRDAIVTDSVDRFATSMRAGAVFPPIVCYPVQGKLVIIDGNNRQAAARKANHDTIFGIIIAEDTPSELIQLMTVKANAHHGVTPDLSWRLKQAFHLVSMGASDERAADAASVSAAQLRSARAVQTADHRARALKINGFPDLAAASRQALGVVKDEAVFYQAGKVAVDTGMTTDEVRDMLRTVKSLPSEGERIAHIGTIAQSRTVQRAVRKATGKANNRLNSPAQALNSGIGKVLAVDPSALVRYVVTPHDRDTINHRLDMLDQKSRQIRLAMATLARLGDEDDD